MNFEWDDTKNKENIRKHGFDFSDAWRLFESPLIIDLDDREDYGEQRWAGLGILDDRVVKIIFSRTKTPLESSHFGRQKNMNESNTQKLSMTDWARVDMMTDDEIDTSDSPELGDEFFANAKLWVPKNKRTVTLSVENDVLDWFENQGPGYQYRINAALKIYADAHRR